MDTTNLSRWGGDRFQAPHHPMVKKPNRKKNRPTKRGSNTAIQIKTQLGAQAAGILSEGLTLESFAHRGVRGIEREEPVRRFLRSHLPGRFHVGQGSVASSKVILDRQHDIVVADRDVCFILLNAVSAQLMIIESVHVIVEVRSRHSELAKVANSLRLVRQLEAEEGMLQLGNRGSAIGKTDPPVHTVILYEGPKSKQTLVSALIKANWPDTECRARLAVDFVLALSSSGEHGHESGYLIGYSRPHFHHHYYPRAAEEGLEGPKILHEGRDSFAYWYAAILHHLSGVIAYPPVLHSYLGHQMTYVRRTDNIDEPN